MFVVKANCPDNETTRLDALMAQLQEMAKLLDERREAVICAAVTGDVTIGTRAEAPK